ncbi:MAG: hypothetical protein WC509_02010 [Candidatus Izemoplasmatales bacterium]
MNKKNIEIIYDAIDGYAGLLYEHLKTPYLQGVVEACDAIHAGDVGPEMPEAARRAAALAIGRAMGVDFQKEEIRKALQLLILKGFKHARRPNADTTPDTIGILAAHLIAKLLPGTDPLVLFDPFVGTGNLIVTAANHLDRPAALYGVERDMTSYKLAEAMFAMTDRGDDLYLQDTFTFEGLAADVILTDFPLAAVADDGGYLPYEAIRHHRRNLKPDGFLLGVVSNDFFSIPGADAFRTLIAGSWNVVGFIKLPDSMFKGMGKSILILQNASGGAIAPAKVLLADIPSFEDEEAAARAIRGIDIWFTEHR